MAKKTKEEFFEAMRQRKAFLTMPMNMAEGMVWLEMRDGSGRMALSANEIPQDIHEMIVSDIVDQLD